MRLLSMLEVLLAIVHDTSAIPKDPADGSDFVDCGQFTTPGWTIPQWNCLRFLGYPTNIAGAIVDVYFATDTLATSTPASDALMAKHVKQVRNGIDKALPEYATFAKVPPTIRVVLSPDLPQVGGKPSNADGLTICKADKTVCFCWIRMNRAEDPADPFNIERTTAHELYHTIQEVNHDPYHAGPTTGWWVEGSPTFFDSNYYPDHRSGTAATAYYPNNPLYNPCVGIDTNTHECRGYGAYLFFQFLSNKGLSLAQINGLVMRQSGSTAISDARRTMSRDADMAQYWPFFAQAFRDKKILFSDGSPVPLRAYEPSIYDVVEQTAPITLAKTGDSVNVQIKVKTFAIAVGKFTLKKGLTVEMKLKPLQTDASLYWRAGKATVWDRFSADQTLVIPCTSALKMEFIFTSTRDVEDEVAEISFMRKSKKKCKCKRQATDDNDEDDDDDDGDGDDSSCPVDGPGGTGFVLWPLYYPETGGGYCPTGTHMSKIAIWCCPDGTELDEAVASEASICCKPGEDCSKEIIPYNLRCADPSWTLWSKNLRQVGCCMEGYVPNLSRYCVTDRSELGRGYSVLSYGNGAASATAPTTSPTSSSKPSQFPSNADTTTAEPDSAPDDNTSWADDFSFGLGRKTSSSKSSTASSVPGLLGSRTGGSLLATSTFPPQATSSSEPPTVAILQATSSSLGSRTEGSVALSASGFISVTTGTPDIISSPIPQTTVIDAAGFIFRGLGN